MGKTLDEVAAGPRELFSWSQETSGLHNHHVLCQGVNLANFFELDEVEIELADALCSDHPPSTGSRSIPRRHSFGITGDDLSE
jgi:hypothetical protein